MSFYDLRQNAVEGFVKNLAKLGKHFETRPADVVFPCADGSLKIDAVGKWDIDTENISKPKELKKYIEEKLVNPNAIRPMIVD